jgi:hypothetical protein
MRRVSVCALAACVSFAATTTAGVSGIAVSAHKDNTGQNNLCGFYGAITKYIIEDGEVTGSEVLHPGPARFATLRSDGKKAAFIMQNKDIMVMDIDGDAGSAVKVATAASTSTGYLDWPDVDGKKWLYFSDGGYADNGSRNVRKANVESPGQTESVVTFNCPQWLWSVALDGDKCVVRPKDGTLCREGNGRMYRHQFSWGGQLSCNSPNDVKPGQCCGEAIAPSAEYMMLMPTVAHNSISFYKWDKTLIVTHSVQTMNEWGSNLGSGWNRNRWSCNSDKWICTMQGWDGRKASAGGNQVLYNWMDHEQLNVSGNAANSKNQNEAGDFWVGDATGAYHRITPAEIEALQKAQPFEISLVNATTSAPSVRIRAKGNARASWVEIVDMHGRTIERKSLPNLTVAEFVLGKNASGAYVVRVKANGREQAREIRVP